MFLTSCPRTHRYDRRSSRRMQRHNEAWILDGLRPLACRVANVSPDGVKVVVPCETQLPEILDIVLVPKAPARRARVAWFKGRYVGLSFADVD